MTMNIDFCDKYDMLPPGALILCAVSGGKDSMYLLEQLIELAPERGLRLCCAHFNHCLRGAASDADRQFVEEYCGRRGLDCVVGAGDVAAYAKEHGMGIEEAARALRYEFLENTAQLLGASRIATAHTADDNTETMLFNLARGCGLNGLCGIPPVRGRIVRPVLTVTASEVLAYLSAHGIPHVEDETNKLDDYTRNKIRHTIVPGLLEINPELFRSNGRTAELLREDEEFLSAIAARFVEENFKNGRLPASKLAALPRPISARVLKSVAFTDLSAAHIDAVRALAAGERLHACADIPKCRVARQYDELIFDYSGQKKLASRTVSIGETVELSESGLELSCEFIENCKEIHNSFNIFFFKSDTICGKISVESRRDGEKIRLAGRGCTKSLKKLFAEARLNGENKQLVPVLYDDTGVIAVFGFGIAERCIPKPGDDVLKIEIKYMERRDTL